MADKKKICILVEPHEYELIAVNARSVDMSLTGYVRRVSLDRLVVHNNYQAIMEYAKEIRRVRKEIHTIISSVLKSGKAYHADLVAINDRLKEIEELERRMLQRTEQDRSYYRKYIRKLHEEVD